MMVMHEWFRTLDSNFECVYNVVLEFRVLQRCRVSALLAAHLKTFGTFSATQDVSDGECVVPGSSTYPQWPCS